MINQKSQILNQTLGGLEVFQELIPDLKVIDGQVVKNVHNPFYDDKNASMSIYQGNGEDGRWLFYDHGDPDYQGDVFDFAALHYDLEVEKEFPEVLNSIIELMELDIPKVGFKPTLSEGESFKIFELVELGKPEQDFLTRYNIDQEVMKSLNAVFISGYLARSSRDHKEYHRKKETDEPMIAYMMKDGAKIYRPNASKANKWRWIGEKPSDYVFGINNLNDDDETVVIMAGEKDVMSFMSNTGMKAVCLNSETSTRIPESLVSILKGKHVNVLYDLDETGSKTALKLSKIYSYENIELPENLAESGGKDFSDYVERGYDIEEIVDDINSSNPLNEKLFVELTEEEKKERKGGFVVDGKRVKLLTRRENERETADTDSEEILRKTVDNEGVKNQSTDHEATTDVRSEPINRGFNPDVFDNLPEPLNSFVTLYNDKIGKDVVLLSGITAIGSILPNSYFDYHGDKVRLNLFSFVSAPPASGKSRLNHGGDLVSCIHDRLKSESEVRLAEYRASKEDGETGPVPKYNILLIPANTSSSKIIDQMSDNDGMGLIIDSEADTLTKIQGQDWGLSSHELRRITENEGISKMRKNDGLVEVDEPKVGVLIAGTPNQLKALVPDPENGLFSRILFYVYSPTQKFMSPFGIQGNLQDRITNLCEGLLSKFNFNSNEVKVVFTEAQQSQFVETMEQWLTEVNEIHDVYMAAWTKRSGRNILKLASILTSMRQEPVNGAIECDDRDFKIALSMMTTLKDHAELVYENIESAPSFNHFSVSEEEFFNKLPDEFDKARSRKLGKELGIPPGTSEKKLSKFLANGQIIRYKRGQYRKAS